MAAFEGHTVAFKCCKCGKLVVDGANGAQLSLCLGSTRLATQCFCEECGKKAAKLMVNAMYGLNLPVKIEKNSDERSEKENNDLFGMVNK